MNTGSKEKRNALVLTMRATHIFCVCPRYVVLTLNTDPLIFFFVCVCVCVESPMLFLSFVAILLESCRYM